MKRTKDAESWHYEILESEEGETTLQIKGPMEASTAANMIRELPPLLKDRAGASLTVDLSGVTYLDDFGVLVLVELRKRTTDRGASFLLANAGDRIKGMLSLVDFDSLKEEKAFFSGKRRESMFVRLGDAVLRHISDLKYLVFFVGAVCLSLFISACIPSHLEGMTHSCICRRWVLTPFPLWA